MLIYMPGYRAKHVGKRLRKIMRDLKVDATHMECLSLSAQLLGFRDWEHFVRRDLNAPLSLYDDLLSEKEFSARNEFQTGVLVKLGLGAIAEELLDRANPTGLWGKDFNQASDN